MASSSSLMSKNVTVDPYQVGIPSSALHRGIRDNTISRPANFSTIKVGDSQVVKFDDGFEVTGRELSVLLRVLKDMAKDSAPEEFI